MLEGVKMASVGGRQRARGEEKRMRSEARSCRTTIARNLMCILIIFRDWANPIMPHPPVYLSLQWASKTSRSSIMTNSFPFDSVLTSEVPLPSLPNP